MKSESMKAQMRSMVREMREICDAMEALMAMPDQETRPEEATASGGAERARTTSRRRVTVGDRVRIVVKGEYHGRLGVVTGTRGSMFWWILLEETETMAAKRVYKMRTSFHVVEPN